MRLKPVVRTLPSARKIALIGRAPSCAFCFSCSVQHIHHHLLQVTISKIIPSLLPTLIDSPIWIIANGDKSCQSVSFSSDNNKPTSTIQWQNKRQFLEDKIELYVWSSLLESRLISTSTTLHAHLHAKPQSHREITVKSLQQWLLPCEGRWFWQTCLCRRYRWGCRCDSSTRCKWHQGACPTLSWPHLCQRSRWRPDCHNLTTDT